MQANLLSHLLGEELYKHFLTSFLFGASVLFLDSESSECQPGQLKIKEGVISTCFRMQYFTII
jgi:hypothetical protein